MAAETRSPTQSTYCIVFQNETFGTAKVLYGELHPSELVALQSADKVKETNPETRMVGIFELKLIRTL